MKEIDIERDIFTDWNKARIAGLKRRIEVVENNTFLFFYIETPGVSHLSEIKIWIDGNVFNYEQNLKFSEVGGTLPSWVRNGSEPFKLHFNENLDIRALHWTVPELYGGYLKIGILKESIQDKKDTPERITILG